MEVSKGLFLFFGISCISFGSKISDARGLAWEGGGLGDGCISFTLGKKAL